MGVCVRRASERAGPAVTYRGARIGSSKMNNLAQKWSSLLSLVSVSGCVCLPFAAKKASAIEISAPNSVWGLTPPAALAADTTR